MASGHITVTVKLPRELARLKRQRDALLKQLQSLVTLGNLAFIKGDANTEIHIDHIRKADRLCKRVQAQKKEAVQRTLRDARR